MRGRAEIKHSENAGGEQREKWKTRHKIARVKNAGKEPCIRREWLLAPPGEYA